MRYKQALSACCEIALLSTLNPTGSSASYTPRMESNSSPLSHMLIWVQRYADTVMARDNLHLSPALISKAAARRLHQGIKAIEAYLHRFLLLLAMQIEPELASANRARAIYGVKGVRKPAPCRGLSFRMPQNRGIDFALSHRFERLRADRRGRGSVSPTQITARPYLERMAVLRALMSDPYKRARRLAWTLARRRPGLLLVPGCADAVRNRHGTEFSALYTAMATGILTQSRARPPPLGPVPRPPPRIRRL
ncbi:MAG: hypothetical protein AAF296_13405 [Pseudomonadota bacterium]